MEANLSLVLPPEVTTYLFTFLEAKDLIACCQSCRKWKKLAADNRLWQPLFIKRWVRKENYLIKLEQNQNFQYKKLYLDKISLERSWSKQKSVLYGIDSKIIFNVESFQFNDKYFITAHWDGSVKIFERNPTGYEKSLVGVQLTLKHELHELHQGLIWWLEVKDNVAVTAGDDGQIKLLDIEEGKEVRSYTHKGAVWGIGVDIESDLIVAGGNFGYLTVWKLSTGETMASIKIARAILDLSILDSDTVAIGAEFGNLELWSIKEKKCVETLKAHRDTIICMKREKDVFLSASTDGTVIIWDLKTKKHLKTFNAEGKAWSCGVFEDKLVLGVLNEQKTNPAFVKIIKLSETGGYQYDVMIPIRGSFRMRTSCLHIFSDSIMCCNAGVFALDFSGNEIEESTFQVVDDNTYAEDTVDTQRCIVS